MRRNIFSVSLVLGLAAVSSAVYAAEAVEPTEWLLKASESARHVSYQGVVVYRDSEKIETLRIVHRHKGGREQERLTSLSGAPRDIVRDDDHVRCINSHEGAHDHPDQAAGSPQSLLPEMSPHTLRRVAPHYAFRNLGEARVAGRLSRGVAIEPRDEFRYGYEVWADARTAVPLKVSLLDRKGRVIEQMLYTEVSFPASIPDRAFAMTADAHAPHPQVTGKRGDKEPAAVAIPVSQPAATGNIMVSGAWMATGLPPGFEVVLRSGKPGPDGAVEHVLLTDGLSAVSVFSARMAQQDRLFRGFSHMGAMNAYGRMVGLFHVTVVGEVPQATVRLIGDGLTPAQ